MVRPINGVRRGAHGWPPVRPEKGSQCGTVKAEGWSVCCRFRPLGPPRVPLVEILFTALTILMRRRDRASGGSGRLGGIWLGQLLAFIIRLVIVNAMRGGPLAVAEATAVLRPRP